VEPNVDPQRPLSAEGHAHAAQLAERAREHGCAPAAIWHSGKLRARQTAEAFWRVCSPFAEFKMVRGLGPDDPPDVIHAAILKETRDILIAGHIPNLTALLQRVLGDAARFPAHGMVALETLDGGVSWSELWRS
jgi:phosphohistidine phosphatase